MAIDSIRAGMALRLIRTASLNTHSYEIHKLHGISGQEQLDPSLTNERIYSSRADWFIAAAIGGFIDVDVPIREGGRRFLPFSQAQALILSTKYRPAKSGMRLY